MSSTLPDQLPSLGTTLPHEYLPPSKKQLSWYELNAICVSLLYLPNINGVPHVYLGSREPDGTLPLGVLRGSIVFDKTWLSCGDFVQRCYPLVIDDLQSVIGPRWRVYVNWQATQGVVWEIGTYLVVRGVPHRSFFMGCDGVTWLYSSGKKDFQFKFLSWDHFAAEIGQGSMPIPTSPESFFAVAMIMVFGWKADYRPRWIVGFVENLCRSYDDLWTKLCICRLGQPSPTMMEEEDMSNSSSAQTIVETIS